MCPLGNLEDVRKDGYRFYHPKLRGLSLPRVWKSGQPSSSDLLPIEEGGTTDMVIDNERWQRLPTVNATWTLASDDANFGNGNPRAKPRPTPRHIHTEFLFQGNTVHIDFVRFIEWGPLSGFEEFQFFLNGQFASRGGCYVCYATCCRDMPACLRIGNVAIIASGGFEGAVLPSYDGLSTWKIEIAT